MSFRIHSESAYRRRKKRIRLIMISLAAAVIATACAAPVFLTSSEGESSIPTSQTADAASAEKELSSEIPEFSEPTAEISSDPADESAEAASEPSSAVSISETGTMSSGSSDTSYMTISGPAVDASSQPADDEPSSEESSEPAVYYAEYDYTLPVPENTPVDDSYFDTAVFVGNSRTQGFILYSGLSNVTAYTDRGLSVQTAATKEVVSVDGKKVTVLDALRKNAACESVYLMFGINELGWPQEHVFIEKYIDLIDAIQEHNPDAKIYVQSILPVSKAKSDSDEYINNTRIQEFNTMIREMAVEQQVYYLDLYAAMADEAGDLPDDAASDGIHLKKSYCVKWLDYLRNHVVVSAEEGI